MLDLEEEYGLSDLFKEEFEAPRQDAGVSSMKHDESPITADDNELPTSLKDLLAWNIFEDIGFDEDYSDAAFPLHTPWPDAHPLDQSEGSYLQTYAGSEDDTPSTSTSESPPQDSPPNSHRSALPSYLMGLPQLTLSAAFAQGRRGSALANDDPVTEDPAGYSTEDDESDAEWLDSPKPPRLHPMPDRPTLVDIVAQNRAIIRDEWDRVFHDDEVEDSNPYYEADWWDEEAVDSYTRFPYFAPGPASC